MDIRDINVGDKVSTDNGFELIVHGVFTTLDPDTGELDTENAVIYGDFIGNNGDFFEININELAFFEKANHNKKINKNLQNIKFYVDGKGIDVYIHLLKLGCKPPRQHYSTYDICQPFVYIKENGKWEYGNDMLNFTKHPFREVKVTEVLNTEIEI